MVDVERVTCPGFKDVGLVLLQLVRQHYHAALVLGGLPAALVLGCLCNRVSFFFFFFFFFFWVFFLILWMFGFIGCFVFPVLLFFFRMKNTTDWKKREKKTKTTKRKDNCEKTKWFQVKVRMNCDSRETSRRTLKKLIEQETRSLPKGSYEPLGSPNRSRSSTTRPRIE